MIISSQAYREDEIIEKKINNSDFEVLVSPEFDYEGEVFQVVIDGHHSYEAAIKTGNKPIYIVATSQDVDYIELLKTDVELFLETTYIDSDWYYLESGMNVWA